MALGARKAPPATAAPPTWPRGADGSIEPGFAPTRGLGGAEGLELIVTEWARFADSTTADAAGAATLTLQAPQDRVLLVDRIVVKTDSTATSSAEVYDGPVDDRNLVDYTPLGNGDVADEHAPIVIAAGAILTIAWSGADAAATCTATVRYRKAIIR